MDVGCVLGYMFMLMIVGFVNIFCLVDYVLFFLVFCGKFGDCVCGRWRRFGGDYRFLRVRGSFVCAVCVICFCVGV